MDSIQKTRTDIIGFNDLWFIAIGTIILSLITDLLFNGCSFLRYTVGIALVNWSFSLLFAIVNWMIMREVMIVLRRRFPDSKNNFKRISILFFLIVITIIVVDRIGSYTLGQVFGESYNHPSSNQLLIPILLISIMILAMYEAIYYYYQLQESVRAEEQSKQVIIEAQLDALRNQARPHFLFNSFNTLRDVIENDSKEEAMNFVNKLSDVYRYILESGKVNLITLEEEIKFAKAYLHIQLERFGDNLIVEWGIEDHLMTKMVIPMSLQLLLENAIKHNVVSKSSPLFIHVSTVNDYLVVNNKIQLKSTQLPSTKIGLNSISKRYGLISDKPLSIFDDGQQFEVTLPLIQL